MLYRNFVLIVLLSAQPLCAMKLPEDLGHHDASSDVSQEQLDDIFSMFHIAPGEPNASRATISIRSLPSFVLGSKASLLLPEPTAEVERKPIEQEFDLTQHTDEQILHALQVPPALVQKKGACTCSSSAFSSRSGNGSTPQLLVTSLHSRSSNEGDKDKSTPSPREGNGVQSPQIISPRDGNEGVETLVSPASSYSSGTVTCCLGCLLQKLACFRKSSNVVHPAAQDKDKK